MKATDIDLSKCKTLEEIRSTIDKAMDKKTIVVNGRDAKRHFRKKGIKGRIRSSVAFREHKEIPSLGPLHRDLLVCALVMEYHANDNIQEKAYSINIITY